MKLKNIYANKINVTGKPIEVGATIEVSDGKTDEIKNLIRNKYVEVI